MIRFLHSADWHIGRMLYGRKRYAEFEFFLDWLVGEVDRRKVDAVLVPGDVFDTRTPSNRAQELYYDFLVKVSRTGCRHVVVTSGNHDSPSFLDAPRALLKVLDVHVVGQVGKLDDELIELLDSDGEVEALVLAVPYLRDRDVRKVGGGESAEDKELKLVEGIRMHYEEVGKLAVKRLEVLGLNVPVLGMGHLFAAGGKVGDGVRDLYVGSLGAVGADIFPECCDYVALGHLHVAQKVGGVETVRYSGSPIPMGFGESGQSKEVVIIDYEEGGVKINRVGVPCFQKLVRLKGGVSELVDGVRELVVEESDAWVEVEYVGQEVVPDLRGILAVEVEGSDVEIQRVKVVAKVRGLKGEVDEAGEVLEDLDEVEVFRRCMDVMEVTDEDREVLIECYKEILLDYKQTDSNAV